MDKVTPFKIAKHLPLSVRFNLTAEPSLKWQETQAWWLLYGKRIQPSVIEELSAVADDIPDVLAAWRVGPYEVLAISGELTEALKEKVDHLNLDCADANCIPDLNKPGLIVLDMDSTSVQIECIDEIAALAGVGKEVSEVTERAMRGELDFEESLRARVAKLENTEEAILEKVRNTLPLMPEIKETIKTLHEYDWHVAIASGGFTYFSDYLKDHLQLVHAESNQLEIKDNRLTGQLVGKVIDAQEKANILLRLAGELEIESRNTIAVGDGANDLLMMRVAGFGIAYHAKPKVVKAAPASISYAHLGGIICILSASLYQSGICCPG